jgi:hypothetical protein
VVGGVSHLRAIACESLLKALAGDGQLAHKELRNASRRREARAALDRAAGAAFV